MIGSRVGYAGPARGGGGKVQRAQLEKAAPPVTAVPGWSAQTRAQRGTSVWNPGVPPPLPEQCPLREPEKRPTAKVQRRD